MALKIGPTLPNTCQVVSESNVDSDGIIISTPTSRKRGGLKKKIELL